MGHLTNSLAELESAYKERDIAIALSHSTDTEVASYYIEKADELTLYIEHIWTYITKKDTEVPFDSSD